MREAEKIIAEEIDKELTALATHLQGVLQRRIRDKGLVASGSLVGSIAVAKETVERGRAVSVGSPLEHGVYMEFGTKPHWPPFEPIRQWVELKKSQFSTASVSVSGGRTRGRSRRPSGKSALDRIAFLIQRKIARKGVEGRHYMSDSLNELGVRFEKSSEGNDITYFVDTAGFIDKQGGDIWSRIEQRLG